MTPNQIVMLMSVYTTGTLGNFVPEGCPAHTDALHYLTSNELIEQEDVNIFTLTNRGSVLVKAMTDLRLPELAWRMPE